MTVYYPYSLDYSKSTVSNEGEIGIETLKHPWGASVLYREFTPRTFDGQRQLIGFQPNLSHGLNPVELGTVPAGDYKFKWLVRNGTEVPKEYQVQDSAGGKGKPELILDTNLKQCLRNPEENQYFIPKGLYAQYVQAKGNVAFDDWTLDSLYHISIIDCEYVHDTRFLPKGTLTKRTLDEIVSRVERKFIAATEAVKSKDESSQAYTTLGLISNKVGESLDSSLLDYIDSKLAPVSSPSDRPMQMGLLGRWANDIPEGFRYCWIVERVLSILGNEEPEPCYINIGQNRSKGLARIRGRFGPKYKLGTTVKFDNKIKYLIELASMNKVPSLLSRYDPPYKELSEGTLSYKDILSSHGSFTVSYQSLFDEIPSLNKFLEWSNQAFEDARPGRDFEIEAMLNQISTEVSARQNAIIAFIAKYNFNSIKNEIDEKIQGGSNLLLDNPEIDPALEKCVMGMDGYPVTPLQFVRDVFYHRTGGIRTRLFERFQVKLPQYMTRSGDFRFIMPALLCITDPKKRRSSHYETLVRERLFRYRKDRVERNGRLADFNLKASLKGVVTPDKYRDDRYPFDSIGMIPSYIRTWEYHFVGVSSNFIGSGINLAKASLPELLEVFPKETWGNLALRTYRYFREGPAAVANLKELCDQLLPKPEWLKPFSLSRRFIRSEGITSLELDMIAEEHFESQRESVAQIERLRERFCSKETRPVYSSIVPVNHRSLKSMMKERGSSNLRTKE